MNTIKDGCDVIKGLRPAPVDQTNVIEDRILDLLFDTADTYRKTTRPLVLFTAFLL